MNIEVENRSTKAQLIEAMSQPQGKIIFKNIFKNNILLISSMLI